MTTTSTAISPRDQRYRAQAHQWRDIALMYAAFVLYTTRDDRVLDALPDAAAATEARERAEDMLR